MNNFQAFILLVVGITGFYYFTQWYQSTLEDEGPNPYSDGFEDFCDVFIGGISLANNGEHFTFYTNDPNKISIPVNITCKGLDDFPTDVYKAKMTGTNDIGKYGFMDLEHVKENKNGEQLDKWVLYEPISNKEDYQFREGTYEFKFKLEGDTLYYPAKIEIVLEED